MSPHRYLSINLFRKPLPFHSEHDALYKCLTNTWRYSTTQSLRMSVLTIDQSFPLVFRERFKTSRIIGLVFVAVNWVEWAPLRLGENIKNNQTDSPCYRKGVLSFF